MKKKIITLSLGVLFALGCGQHPVDEYDSIVSEVAQETCSCPDLVSAAGYGSMAECVADNSLDLTETQKECFRAAYDRNESTASPTVSCTIDQANGLKDCISGASCNPAALQSCLDMFDIEADCPAFPTAVQAEFDACFPSG
jgi:hypothetical protein